MSKQTKMIRKNKSSLNKKLKNKNKIAVSEIVSYVLLISITVTVAIGVYSFLLIIGKGPITPKIDCDEGVNLEFIKLEDFNSGIEPRINVTIHNNGRFNIDSFILLASRNSSIEPIIQLKPDDGTNDLYYDFATQLAPGETRSVLFYIQNFNNPNDEIHASEIKRITIQIVNTINGKRTNCLNSQLDINV